ncbi:MAG: DUF4886 domain-containing protein [Phycisphaeraceae bacterium]
MRAFILFIFTSLAFAAPASAQADKDTGPIRILFIGNSYTSFNNLPAIVQSLATAAKEKRAFEFEMVTPGGCTWQRHFDDERIDSVKKIKEKRWDYIVLQEQSQMPFMYPKDAHKYGVLLGKLAQEHGAVPLIYMTWAREKEPEKQSKITETYLKVADELKAPCAPAGTAWEVARKERPALKLYNKDGSHPSPSGSFLTACVFYATIYDRSPQGLTGKHLWKNEGKTYLLCDVPDVEAGFLEKVAWEAVKAEKERKK